MTTEIALPRWWGTFDLELMTNARWQIGPFQMWVERRANEWRVAYEAGRDRLAKSLELDINPTDETPADGAEQIRFVAPGPLVVSPRLADRPVVTRPEITLEVVAASEATMFVSTPVWVRLQLGGPDGPKVLQVPTYHLNDTWFGPTTMSGELCYASRTSARLDIGDVPLRPHRAVTKVLLRNQATDGMRVERLSLPVPELGLYVDRDGVLWTNDVTVDREEGGTTAHAEYSPSAPSEAVDAEVVVEPTLIEAEDRVRRALSAWLS